MNYGLHLSAGGVLSNLYRQDLLANNLANVETVGFKPDSVITRERLPEREESGAFTEPHWMLERLGGGVLLEPTTVSMDQGGLQNTGGPLDLAFDGGGLFMVGSAAENPAEMRLTRDGRFTIDDAGHVVMSTTGLRLLDDAGRPIRLTGQGPVEIAGDGTISRDGNAVARIATVETPGRNLVKAGTNLLRLRDGVAADQLGPATGMVRQGHLESSAVDPIKTLTAMIGATKAAQGNAKLMQYHDFIMGQTVNTFGRVS